MEISSILDESTFAEVIKMYQAIKKNLRNNRDIQIGTIALLREINEQIVELHTSMQSLTESIHKTRPPKISKKDAKKIKEIMSDFDKERQMAGAIAYVLSAVSLMSDRPSDQ